MPSRCLQAFQTAADSVWVYGVWGLGVSDVGLNGSRLRAWRSELGTQDFLGLSLLKTTIYRGFKGWGFCLNPI